jgi:inosine/xanthosine triphosphate pyrophosphatase family protein
MKYLFATTNKAKVRRYGEKLKENGVDLVTLNDLDLELDVDESGKNPIENAIIKATAYNKATNMTTIAIDDGLFLDNVPDEVQPGTHVRRVNGKRLNDEEMIDYYISLVNKYGTNGELTGYFKKGVAIVTGDNTYTFEHKSGRKFTNKQSPKIDEGYPLASIQMIESLGKFKSELTHEEEEQLMKLEKEEITQFIINTIKKLEKDKEIDFER